MVHGAAFFNTIGRKPALPQRGNSIVI